MDTRTFTLLVCATIGAVQCLPVKSAVDHAGPLTVQDTCFGADNATGWFTSPNYPANYPDNLRCVGLVGYNDGLHYASVTFTDFYTENGYDYVTIRSDRVDGPVIGNYSGNLIFNLPSVASPTRLFLEFVSDAYVNYRGFNATYNQGMGDSCNQYIATGQGIIQSPNYPSNYPNNMDCSYVLGNVGDQVTVFFQDFLTESSWDYVRVYGSALDGPLLAEFDGTTGQCKEISYFDRLVVSMTSDSSVTRSGFWAYYSIGDDVALCDSHTTLPPTTTLPDATMGDQDL